MTDPNPVVDALLASGRRELTTTPTEDTAVIDAETPVAPIPAEGAPHAYVAVQRRGNEWYSRAAVVHAHETTALAGWRRRPEITLLPIGPDGDTGTRAIVEPRRIGTPVELNELPAGSWVFHPAGSPAYRHDGVMSPDWWMTFEGQALTAEQLLADGPVTLIHIPTEES